MAEMNVSCVLLHVVVELWMQLSLGMCFSLHLRCAYARRTLQQTARPTPHLPFHFSSIPLSRIPWKTLYRRRTLIYFHGRRIVS